VGEIILSVKVFLLVPIVRYTLIVNVRWLVSLYDKQLICYKVCNDGSDCPSGQTYTDGWGILYEHEYYKICMGTTVTKSKEEGK